MGCCQPPTPLYCVPGYWRLGSAHRFWGHPPPRNPIEDDFRKWRTSCRHGAVPADLPKPSRCTHPRRIAQKKLPSLLGGYHPLAGLKAWTLSSVRVV